jgi:thiol:disulfide interchange protein
MINRLLLSFILLFACHCLAAQNINFNKGSWNEMLTKSGTDKKLIFVDIYAVWCGPCKAMAKNVFTQAAVANKFNTSFINYMLDAEKGEGIKLAEKYQVAGFPTYLFVDSRGNVVYKIEGALPAEKFIAEADKALQKYKDGE